VVDRLSTKLLELRLRNLKDFMIAADGQLVQREIGRMVAEGTVRVFGRNFALRMPLNHTRVRFKLLHACDQWHSSRVPTRESTPLIGVNINPAETLQAALMPLAML
jgi:hypothetical protein